VVAAHDGTVTVFSNCFVRVTGSNGWATNYYHLDNLVVSSGDVVTRNQTIGVYANTKSQALCDGGHSTGPHVHFSLLNNGIYASLLGVELSGYTVHPGRHSYDSNHSYMWIERNGTKYYAYSDTLLNDDTTTLLTVLKGGSGTVTGPGINCGGDCTQSYNAGTRITLKATPAAGWKFANWRGQACAGSTNPTCSFPMNVSRTVKATFITSSGQNYIENFNDGIANGWVEDENAAWIVTGGWYRAYKSDPRNSELMTSYYSGTRFTNGDVEVDMLASNVQDWAHYAYPRSSTDFDCAGVSCSGSAIGFDVGLPRRCHSGSPELRTARLARHVAARQCLH